MTVFIIIKKYVTYIDNLFIHMYLYYISYIQEISFYITIWAKKILWI